MVVIATPLYRGPQDCHRQMVRTRTTLHRQPWVWEGWLHQQGSDVQRNRNILVAGALQLSIAWEWMFCLDADISFRHPVEALQNMLDVGADIVAAPYLSQPDNSGLRHVVAWDGDRRRVSGDEDQLVRGDSAAAGAMLIRREVLEALRAPWFRHEIVAGDIAEVGEDIGFCHYAWAAGCTLTIDCRHWATHHVAGGKDG